MDKLSQLHLVFDNSTSYNMDNSTTANPLTLEEFKEPLTPAEREEADNPYFIHPLNMFIEGLNSIPNLSKSQRNIATEQFR